MSKETIIKLGFFRTENSVEIPKFSTNGAACFDISFSPYGKTTYDGYTPNNGMFNRQYGKSGVIRIMPGERVMVPTGLLFEIPAGYSLRIHPRSSVAYKKGLVLVNGEAIIDSDYFNETFLLILNTSATGIDINPGERLVQAELVKIPEYSIQEISKPPKQTTDRTGGIGSTG